MGKKKGTPGRKEIVKLFNLYSQKLITSCAKFLECYTHLINLAPPKIGDMESSELVLKETTNARNKLFGSFVTLKNNWNECNRLAASADEHSTRDLMQSFICKYEPQMARVELAMTDVFNTRPSLT